VFKSRSIPVRDADNVFAEGYETLNIVPEVLPGLIICRGCVGTFVPRSFSANLSLPGVIVSWSDADEPMLGMLTVPFESTYKYFVDPVLFVTEKISCVGELADVCLIWRPVESPVGDIGWSEEGLFIKQFEQDDPEIVFQVGTPPADTVNTYPVLPIPSFANELLLSE